MHDATLALDDELLVPNGLGAPKGFTPEEHAAWALRTQHPYEYKLDTDLDEDLRHALEFECSHEQIVAGIHSSRQMMKDELTTLAAECDCQREAWVDTHGLTGHPLAQKMHGPLFTLLVQETGYSAFDATLANDIAGFPLLGQLPPSGPDVKELKSAGPTMSIEELLAHRRVENLAIVNSLRTSEWDHELFELAMEDAEFGCSSKPVPLTDWHVSNVTLCRRIPIREERSKGWRARPVDHETECGVNPATSSVDSVVYDGISTMVFSALFFTRAGVQPSMWKRDVHKAFRRLIIKKEHGEFAWSVFPFAGTLWTIKHYGMPFGALSANSAWHRVGSFIRFLSRRLFLAPVNRYVDDFFGVGRQGVRRNGGWVVTLLCKLLGFNTDADKSDDYQSSMVVLGSRVEISWSEQRATARVDEIKATKWTSILQKILVNQRLSPENAF